MKFTITKEDYDNSSKEYHDLTNCPLAIAVKRQLNLTNFAVGKTLIYSNGRLTHFIKPGFSKTDFNKLAKTGETFETVVVMILNPKLN